MNLRDVIPGLVSIVLPVKDGEQHLAAALESVRAQTYEAFEIVVVDDGSTDRSAEVARSFTGVRVVSQPNAGVPVARNRGVSESRGEFVAFLDHDDEWTPQKLEVQVARLVYKPELGYVVARLEFVLEPGMQRPSWLRPELLVGPQPGRVPSNLLVRRAALDAVGPFRPELRHGDDVDWFTRAVDAGVQGEMVPEVLLRHRVRKGNLTANVEKSRADMFRALRASIVRKRGE